MKSGLKIFLLVSLLFSLIAGSFQQADAATSFVTQSGKKLNPGKGIDPYADRVNDPTSGNGWNKFTSSIGNFFMGGQFVLKAADKGSKLYNDEQTIYNLIEQTKTATDNLKNCSSNKQKNYCDAVKQQMYTLQGDLIKYGIMLHVPSGSSTSWDPNTDFAIQFQGNAVYNIFSAAESASHDALYTTTDCNTVGYGDTASVQCTKSAANKAATTGQTKAVANETQIAYLNQKDLTSQQITDFILSSDTCKKNATDPACVQAKSGSADQAKTTYLAEQNQQAQSNLNQANSVARNTQNQYTTPQAIVSQGLFTTTDIPIVSDCQQAATLSKSAQDAVKSSTGASEDTYKPLTAGLNGGNDKGSSFVASMVNSSVTKPAGQLFTIDCGFSLMNVFIKINDPVTITNNEPVMKVISIAIFIALGASIILIAAYGVIYTVLGLEGMNPYKFGLRMLFAMMATYYLPYLMQDILNINNVLVNNITSIDPSVGNAGWNAAAGAGVSLMFLATAIISAIITSLIATGGTASLLWLIVIISVIILIIKPMIQIVMWWYLRMLTIFVLAIFGPFFVIMMALPQTAKMGSRWINMFIAQTFSQSFMGIGIYLFVTIFMNLTQFNQAVGTMGPVGNIFLMYAFIMFLAELPRLGGQLLGSNGDPIGAAGMARAAEQMTNTVAAGIMLGTKMTNEGITKGKLLKEIGDDKANVQRGFNEHLQPQTLSGKGSFANNIASIIDLDKNKSENERKFASGNLSNDELNMDALGMTDANYAQLQNEMANGILGDEEKIADSIADKIQANNENISAVEAKARGREFVAQFNKNAKEQHSVTLGTLADINKGVAKGKETQQTAFKKLADNLIQSGGFETRDEAYKAAGKLMTDYGYDQLAYDDSRLADAEKRNIKFDKGINNISINGHTYKGGQTDYKGMAEDVYQKQKKDFNLQYPSPSKSNEPQSMTADHRNDEEPTQPNRSNNEQRRTKKPDDNDNVPRQGGK